MISPLVQGFLTAADQHIETAEHLLPSSQDDAALFAHRAAEALARAMCAQENIADINFSGVAQIAERLPDTHLFKTSFLGLSHLSGKAGNWLRFDRTEIVRVSPKPEDIEALIKRIKSLRTEIRDWLSVL